MLILSFGLIAVTLGKGNSAKNNNFIDQIIGVADTIQWYAVGGLVAFDQIVDNPQLIQSTGGIFRTPAIMLNKIGFDFTIPSDLNAEYVLINEEQKTNVFSSYFFYYPDYGFLGIFFIQAFFGFFSSFVYSKAMQGSKIFILLYAVIFSALLLSGFSDYFFDNFPFYLRLFILFSIIYLIPHQINLLVSKYRLSINQ